MEHGELTLCTYLMYRYLCEGGGRGGLRCMRLWWGVLIPLGVYYGHANMTIAYVITVPRAGISIGRTEELRGGEDEMWSECPAIC